MPRLHPLRAALFLLPACAAPALCSTPAAAQSVAKPLQDVALSIGSGQLVSLPAAMADVFVANEAVADVQVKSQRQLYLLGKAGGATSVYASDAQGKVIWSATVRVGTNIDSIDDMLRLALPDAKIAVATIGSGTVLLTGTVASPEDIAEAEKLAQAYLGKDASIITRLRTATPLQVNLQVRFAEVSRSLVKQIGVNLATIDASSGFKFGLAQGAVSSHAPGLPLGAGTDTTVTLPDGTQVPGSSVKAFSGGATVAAAGRLLGVDILGALDAGETVGLATTLAQPNLTALSGETADFLAGGEYPIPVSQGLGTTSIDYRKYGVSLSYTPTVLSDGRISLRVRPEVSELTSQGSVTLNGHSVPGLTIRRTETTVELGSGQSFMIAGLLSNNSQNSILKLPGAGDVPILGSLFRSASYRRGETELVIVVTPYLVRPTDAGAIALPTDGFRTPDDAQRVLGHMESAPPPRAPESTRTGPTPGFATKLR